MSKLLGFLSPLGFGGGSRQRDDDFVDRISHSYTVMILVGFAIVVSTKQYVGDPIECWVPAYFNGNYQDYANKVCWVSNTYYNPFSDDIPLGNHPKEELLYYQWVPFILLGQAIFFYLPNTIWNLMNGRSGIAIASLSEAAQNMHEGETQEKTLRYIVRQIDRFCGTLQRKRTRGASCRQSTAQCCLHFCGMNHGTYLLAIYMMVKFFYLANSIGQFFLLDTFMGSEYHLYGVQVIQGLITSQDWVGSKRFPRVTLCDFKVSNMYLLLLWVH